MLPEPEPTPQPVVESVPEPAVDAPRTRRTDIQPCSVCKKTMRVPKNPYTAHQRAARSLPNSFFVKNDVELGAGKRNGKLVEVEDGRGYRIARLTHSHPWLLPETYQLLQDMGNDFADALEGTASEGAVFRVTSVTRTDSQQRKLRRRNLNATGSQSTHSYGASFDIAFVDRMDDNASCSSPQGKWSACSTATRMRASSTSSLRAGACTSRFASPEDLARQRQGAPGRVRRPEPATCPETSLPGARSRLVLKAPLAPSPH